MPVFSVVTGPAADEKYFPTTDERVSVDLTPFVGFLQGLKQGEVFEVILDTSESTRAIKRRFTLAAQAIPGMRVQYSKRANENTVVGRVLAAKQPTEKRPGKKAKEATN